MGAYLLRRVSVTILLMWLISLGVFMMIHLLPGDPAAIILGGTDANPTPEQLEQVRRTLGLDKPLLVQYGEWFSGLLRGDLGNSFLNNRPVFPDIMNRLPRTLLLVVAATAVALMLGIPLGILAARARHTWLDPMISALAVVGFSVPVFVVGLLGVLYFSLHLFWLPPSGYVSFSENPAEALKRLILPVAALSVSPMATIVRMTRASMVEQLSSDYLRTARAKGVSEWSMLFRHGLRNAILPVITVTGLNFGVMFGGSVLVEHIFAWPGINSLLYQSITLRDYPVVQGCVLVSAFIVLLANLLTDLSYAAIDPRIRYR